MGLDGWDGWVILYCCDTKSIARAMLIIALLALATSIEKLFSTELEHASSSLFVGVPLERILSTVYIIHCINMCKGIFKAGMCARPMEKQA